MLGYKPNHEMWARVNAVILGANTAEVMVTFIGAMCSMLIQAGVVEDAMQARAHLAAMLLSPDTGNAPGSLLPLLQAELAKLGDGKWNQ